MLTFFTDWRTEIKGISASTFTLNMLGKIAVVMFEVISSQEGKGETET